MYRLKTSKAFTLIELVFVMVLIGLILGIAIPRVSSTMGLNLRTYVLHVSGFLQAGYEQAIIGHKKIRISFNMDDGSYWADDYLPTQQIPLIDEATKLDDILNTFRKRSEEGDDEEELKKQEAAKFQKIESNLLKPNKLGSSLKFKSIQFPGKSQVFTSGIVSFYISSSGINEEMIINIVHTSDVSYSIIFPPITGKPRIEKGEVQPNS
jgi:prepilin-type N-terminal cleavage/methylation domain-containing protein